MPKDYASQLARLKEQQDKLNERLSAVAQKARAEDRKRDTRRKIVVGGAVLLHMEKDPAFANLVRGVLAQSVGRPIDKEAIADLLAPAPAAAIQTSAA